MQNSVVSCVSLLQIAPIVMMVVSINVSLPSSCVSLQKLQQELQKELGTLGTSESLDGRDSKKDNTDDEDEPSGPKPMLPYSSMFVFSPTNPYVHNCC